MKTKATLFLIVAALLMSSVGCRFTDQTVHVHPSFSAQYIRTNGYHDQRRYPIASMIQSKADLFAYYEKYKNEYDLDRRANPASDYTIGFLDAIDRYDDSFFAKNLLILVLTEEGSGSVRHLVKDVYIDNALINILVERQIPQVGTDDMAEWHIILEMKKSDIKNQAIQVYFSEKRA